jgi:hypothetical protein
MRYQTNPTNVRAVGEKTALRPGCDVWKQAP